MRKFILNTYIDTKTFNPMAHLVEKIETENVTIFQGKIDLVEPKSKYTKEELKKINICNKILSEKGLEELTNDEIEFMLDPAGMIKRLKSVENQMKDPEVLQRMAGFKVEKKIIQLD